MSATLDKIKNFLSSPTSYALTNHNEFFRDNYRVSSYAEALPLTEHYYHPLNPCFLFELTGPLIMQHSPIITIRDGYLTFMDFLINNHQALSRWNTLFLVPKTFESLIPPHLSHFFIGYDFSQKKRVKTNHKFIFAYVTEEYLGGDIDGVFSKLQLSPQDELTFFIPFESNLEKISYNNIFAQKFLFSLSKKLEGLNINHINVNDFLNTSDFSSYEFIDLSDDHYLVFDNFVKFLMASRGCQSVYESKKDNSLFSLDMSMFHQMDLYEIKPSHDLFSELLLYRKHNPHKKLLEDPFFSSSLRDFMNSCPHKA